MPGLLELPKLVHDAVAQVGDRFANACQRRHVAASLTGLIVADRTTVLGIHSEFAPTTDQSGLTRSRTDAAWDVEARNQRRLERLPKDPSTRSSDQRVLPIDNTLIDRDGDPIPDAGWSWDHADQRSQIAQDSIVANDVGAAGTHSPRAFHRYRQQEVGAARKEPFRNHTALVRELIDGVCARCRAGAFPCDGSVTGAAVLTHVHATTDRLGRPRGEVGDRKSNRERAWQGRILKANDLAPLSAPEDRAALRSGDERRWSFTVAERIPEVRHEVRIVILGKSRPAEPPCPILVTNRITWEVSRIVRVARRRRTGTETFPRDGAEQLGLGACQLREDRGQTRRRALVVLASSRLLGPWKQGGAKEWASDRRRTIGEACRAMIRESPRKTRAWAIEQVTARGRSLERVVAQLRII